MGAGVEGVSPEREVRCMKCRRLLCKATANPIRSGEVVEIECTRCSEKNYLKDRPE